MSRHLFFSSPVFHPSIPSISVAGPEYALTAAEPPHLFTIARRWRTGVPGSESSPQAAYYILAGSIYEAPPLGAVLSARLDRCLWTIKAAFARMRADLDPLAAAERAALAAADGGDGDQAAATTTRRVPPPRRYTDAERARMATADRVVAHVLSLHEEEAKGGAGEDGDAAARAMEEEAMAVE